MSVTPTAVTLLADLTVRHGIQRKTPAVSSTPETKIHETLGFGIFLTTLASLLLVFLGVTMISMYLSGHEDPWGGIPCAVISSAWLLWGLFVIHKNVRKRRDG